MTIKDQDYGKIMVAMTTVVTETEIGSQNRTDTWEVGIATE